MYSFVNIATVIRDLARHERGGLLVDDLLRALELAPADLAQLDQLPRDAATGDRQRAALEAATSQPRALALLASAREAATTDGLPGYVDALPALESAPMFGLDELLRFVRTEVLAPAWRGSDDVDVAAYPRALDIVTDGVTGSWVGDATLAATWRGWNRQVPLPRTSTSYDAVFDGARRLATRQARPVVPADWAAQMHDACWAVHLTGRGRTAAIAQLKALRIVLDGCGGIRPALGLVAVVTAAIHATTVADVIATDTHAAMTQQLLRSRH
jgi:hypothetical protein